MEAAGGAEETLQQSAWCAWSATLYAEQCKVSVSGYIVVVGQCMKIYWEKGCFVLQRATNQKH